MLGSYLFCLIPPFRKSASAPRCIWQEVAITLAFAKCAKSMAMRLLVFSSPLANRHVYIGVLCYVCNSSNSRRNYPWRFFSLYNVGGISVHGACSDRAGNIGVRKINLGNDAACANEYHNCYLGGSPQHIVYSSDGWIGAVIWLLRGDYAIRNLGSNQLYRDVFSIQARRGCCRIGIYVCKTLGSGGNRVCLTDLSTRQYGCLGQDVCGQQPAGSLVSIL